MTQQELEKYLWGAATALRGTIDAGDYKQYIFPLLFFKRICDVYDEEFETALAESDNDLEFASFAENHHFQIPAGAHWRDVRATTTNVGMALQDAMRAIEKANPETLFGIFGDASWTNKDRLSDEILNNLIEHYSQYKLNMANVPDDQLGNAYEYLIKKFADDSGHTAAEFYTNRTVVKLMTMIMDPQPGESVYDPTCGSGGLLLNCALHLKEEGKEYRTLKLYGQEINLLTSAMARMNMFMHGIEEFSIVRGDTLAQPTFIENDELKKFNVILANPPYSIKAWDRKSFEKDPYGRNIWGTPPQGCADYAFQQHIHKSLNEQNGRFAILWPHGILFRDMEAEMRRKMIETDHIEAVIGLGANLFYNSPMEAMILVGNTNKPKERKGKVLFVNGKDEVVENKGQAYLKRTHIRKLHQAFKDFIDIPHFAKVAGIDEIMTFNGNLNINFYVKRENTNSSFTFASAFEQWNNDGIELKKSIQNLLKCPDIMGNTPHKTIEEFQLNRSNWELVKFGDIAIQQKQSVDRDNTELKKYVKGEHMGSEDLHLREWGELTDEYLGPAFIRKFEAGDILYGSRRTYLRKVVIAPFNGITSNTTFVIKANEKKIDKRLLPFIMLSEGFAENSIKNSKGSVNPYINWKDISNYEFLLPPKDQQAQLAELLWAMDEVIERGMEVRQKLEIALELNSSELIWHQNHSLRPLVSFADSRLNKLIDGDWIESKDQSDDGIRLLQLADIGIRDFINKSSRFISIETFKRLKCFEVLPEDIIIARMPDPIGRACIIKNIGVRMITAVDCCVVRVDTKHSFNKYLMYLLNTREFLNSANLLASGTTRQRISRKNLEGMKVPKPKLEVQLIISQKLDLIFNSLEEVGSKIASSKALQKSLINQIF